MIFYIQKILKVTNYKYNQQKKKSAPTGARNPQLKPIPYNIPILDTTLPIPIVFSEQTLYMF